MVLGFNHNIGYKGELFHVQTEDSGRANPHIITLLYRGGTIIASAKTSYADIIKADQLELVVESIMKDQHRDMMRRLKAGEFDARAFPSSAAQSPDEPAAPAEPAAPDEPAAPAERPAASVIPAASPAAEPSRPAAPSQVPTPTPSRAPAPSETSPSSQVPAARETWATRQTPDAPRNPVHITPPAPPSKRSLDEVILDYLITGEEK